jgi:hypothetical protein
MPVYSWWQERRIQLPARASPTYERVQSPPPSELGSARVTRAEKTLRRGVFGKKKGTVSVSIELPDSYHINVDENKTSVPLSMPINLQYLPISADLPPKVRTLSARLHALTKCNIDPTHQELPHLERTYSASTTILKTSTPSTSTPLWLEDSCSERLSFVSNILMPMNLPPAACASVEKDTKVLLPSFESCMVTRSYEVEVKIGFEGGDVVLRVPTSIIAKPATALAETALEISIRAADSWTPPGREVTAEARSQPLRLTALDLATDDIQPAEEPEEEEARTEEVVEASPTPPEYEVLVSVDKSGMSQRVTAVAA